MVHGIRGLFEGVELGDTLEATPGLGVDREKYLILMINGLEREGYLVRNFTEEGKKFKFYLEKRRRKLANA